MTEVTQDQITNALTDSMSQFLKQYQQDMKSTLVIEAEVNKVVDAGSGVYNVTYQHNKFEATSANRETLYNIGDKVYVVIPNGNFDKNKIILSPVVASKAIDMLTSGEKVYLTISDNIFKSVPQISLCTYKPHDALITGADQSPLVPVDITGFNGLFMSALQDSRTFNFTCKIQTNIERSRRSGGNYGLVLDIPILQEIDGEPTKKYYSVVMDINNMTGDPYDFQVPALQNLYFTIPDNYTYYDGIDMPPRLRSFVMGFLGEDDTKPDDIFITDVQLLSALEKATEELKGYYTLITASNGYSFLASRTGDIKTLSVTPYYNGRITDPYHFYCYWFKENSLIDTSSDKFQHFGGVGWEILNAVSKKNLKDDGTYSYEYITNKYDYTVSQNDLHCDTRFKCVLVKDKGNVTVTAIATIKNLASPANIQLDVLNSLDGSFAAGIGDVRMQLAFKEAGITDIADPNFTIGYSWQRLDKFGEFIDSEFYTVEQLNKREDNTYYTIIKFPVSEIDETNTVGCTVYVDTPAVDGQSVKRQTIGTIWRTIGIADYTGGHITLTNGDKLYKYDADGDSPLVSDYDGPVSSIIKALDPISLNIFKEDGTELSAEEYKTVTVCWLVPINSMININNNLKTDTTSNVGYYTISGSYSNYNTLSYSIATSYSKNKNDNTIIVSAKAPKSVLKNELVTNTNIRFLKDGESGTNGSKYSAVVTYGGYAYGEKYGNNKYYKLQLIYAADTHTWYLYNPANENYFPVFNRAVLGAKLYTDGVSTKSALSIEWSIFDANYGYSGDAKCPIKIDANSGTITLNGQNWDDSTSTFCTTIQAKVRARRTGSETSDSSITNSEEYVYAYYPIECTYVAKYEYLKNNVPTLEGGFDKVLYASDGTNPQYNSGKPFTVTDALGDLSQTILKDVHVSYGYNWSSSINLTNSEVRDTKGQVITNQRIVKPTTKYDNGVAKNYLRVSLQVTSETMTELNKRKNEITTKLNEAIAKKNYYSALQNSLDIFKNFDYNNYVQRLVTANDLFIIKANLTNTSNALLNSINLVIETCSAYQKEDAVLRNLVQIANRKLEYINNLIIYTAGIGSSQTYINNIINITPETLVIDQIDNDYMQDRYYRLSSIDAINEFNTLVLQTYASDYKVISSSEIMADEIEVENVISDIRSIINNTKFDILCSIVDNVDIEKYRYDSLKTTITARLNSIGSIAGGNKGYSDVVNNIINPIQETTKYYINLANGDGYNNTIADLAKNINDYNNDLTIINDLLKPTNIFIIHAKPIIMITNRYEMSNINGWDGNKLEIAENEGYILAPQIGAGIKEQGNTFTGMVMGVHQVAEKATGTAAEKQKIGMFGFYQGAQSMFLNAKDGSAIFGLNGAGQITIDPTGVRNGKKVGLLYSSSFWKKFKIDGKPDGYTSANYNKQGMLIDFVTPEIRFGNGNFIVDSNGHITAVGGGSISGWEIGEQDFYNSGQKTCAIYSKGTPEQGRMVLDSGAIKSQNSDGNINYIVAHAGKIFTGKHNSVASTANGFYLSEDGLSLKRSWTENNGTERHFSSLVFDLTQENKGPELYSNGHNAVDSPRDGFYIGQNGISISSNNNANRFELNMSSGNYPKIFSNNHNAVGSSGTGFYLSHDGLSMKNSWVERDGTRAESSFVLDLSTSGVNKGPELYSNGHSSVDNTTRNGFYLGQNGLSISNGDNRFEINVASGKYPTLYANGHNNLLSNRDGWYLGVDGFSISHSWKEDEADGSQTTHSSSFRIAMNTDNQGPELYSNGHSSLDSSREGFYLGQAGLSIGSKIYINKDGYMRLGNGATRDNSRCWTIDASGADHSYIGYNTNFFGFDFATRTFADGTGNRQVYIGTDGWRLGTKFAIDNNGNMYLQDGDIECERLIANKEGQIGGWNIAPGQLWCCDNPSDKKSEGIILESSGTIKTWNFEEDENYNYAMRGWRLSKRGDATFDDCFMQDCNVDRLLPIKDSSKIGEENTPFTYIRGKKIYGDSFLVKKDGDWVDIFEKTLEAAKDAKARADEAYSKAEGAYNHKHSISLDVKDGKVSGSTGLAP